MTDKTRSILISSSVWLSRIIVGGAFVLSGFAKGIDPWGSVFKFEQYLSVWDWSQPRSLILTFAILLSVIEFVVGVSVLTGMYRKKTPWVVLFFMAFFLPLTAYIAVESPVDDCGCFGDAFVISNYATFIKNIVLTALAVLLILYNRKVPGLFNSYFQWIVTIISVLYLLALALIGYNIQPVVDFRSFPIGTSLLANDNAESPLFVYEKNGVKKEFEIDNLPDENSDWVFLYRKENKHDNPPFVIENFDGEEVTDAVIPDEGDLIMLIIPEPDRVDLANTMYVNRIHRVAASENVGMIALVGDATSADIEEWQDLSMADYPIYTVEETTLKALARGNMSFVYVRDGKILEKQSLSMLSAGVLAQLENGDISLRHIMGFDGTRALSWLTRGYVIILFILMVLSSFPGLFRLIKFAKHINKKNGAK